MLSECSGLDFTTPQSVWVVTAAAVGQSRVTLNRAKLVVIGCEGKPIKRFYFSRSEHKKKVEFECSIFLLGF